MSLADETHEAVKSWALDELQQISKRNFELAKFFFAISAASFAIVPFSNVSISKDEWWLLTAIIPSGAAVLLSVLMASPADFEINSETNFEEEHRNFAKWSKVIRLLWIVTWLIGVTSLLLVFGGLIAWDATGNVVANG